MYNKEYYKLWAEKNKDKRRESRKNYNIRNKELIEVRRKERCKARRPSLNDKIKNKIQRFLVSEHNKKHRFKYKFDVTEEIKQKIILCIIKDKIYKFSRGNNMFSVEDLLNKYGDNPKCYITGQEINLLDSTSWHLDHIIPKSKGGDNTLENCGITIAQANKCKYDLSYEDFVSLCRQVVRHYDDPIQ